MIPLSRDRPLARAGDYQLCVKHLHQAVHRTMIAKAGMNNLQELGRLGCVVEYKNDSYRLNGLNAIPQVRPPSLAILKLCTHWTQAPAWLPCSLLTFY